MVPWSNKNSNPLPEPSHALISGAHAPHIMQVVPSVDHSYNMYSWQRRLQSCQASWGHLQGLMRRGA